MTDTEYPLVLFESGLRFRFVAVGILSVFVGGGAAVVLVTALTRTAWLSYLPWILLGALVCLNGLILVVRGARIALRLFHDHAEVRGLYSSRIVARDSITTVTGYPKIVWRDASDKRHATRVTALALRTNNKAYNSDAERDRVQNSMDRPNDWVSTATR